MKRRRPVAARAVSRAVDIATSIGTFGTVAYTLSIGAARAEPTAAVAPASPISGMLQGLVGLVIVVACIYAAAWVFRKMGPRTRPGGLVQVVGGASVGSREKVVVVRFAGRTLLLGVAPGQVSLLHAADAADPPAVGDT